MRHARWIVPATVAIVLLTAGGIYAERRAADGGSDGSGVDTGAPHPVVAGNRLVDSRSDATFVPRGVNWSSFEYACTQGWGMSSIDAIGRDAYEAEAAAIADWGANTVRVPLNQDCWLGTRDRKSVG